LSSHQLTLVEHREKRTYREDKKNSPILFNFLWPTTLNVGANHVLLGLVLLQGQPVHVPLDPRNYAGTGIKKVIDEEWPRLESNELPG
jgi:hypothetical protein